MKNSGTSLMLSNEAGQVFRDPVWALVERVTGELEPGDVNSFCCLEIVGSSYVQALRVPEGWLLEWRMVSDKVEGSYIHYRAYRNDGVADEDDDRDLVSLEDVRSGFRAFYNGENPPASLRWRDLEI